MKIPTLDGGFINTDNELDFIKIYELEMCDYNDYL